MEYGPLLFVIQNMRARDREEIFATHHDYGDEQDAVYAQLIMHAAKHGIAWIAYSGREPVAVLGLDLMWPGVGSVWMFATDGWLSVCLGLTRFVRRSIVPLLTDANLHRIQCWSQDGHSIAHRWLESLGATFETMVPGYGRNGEAFCLFAWAKGRDF